MMKMLKYVTLACLLTISSLSQAQQKCAPVAKELYQDLDLASVADNRKITVELLTKNCFDLNFYKKNESTLPVFFSKSLENIVIYESANVDLWSFQESGTKLDLMSYFLLNPYYVFEISAQDKEMVKAWAQKYKVSVDVDNLSFKVPSEERKKIINYLASKQRNTLDTQKDGLGNNSLFYAIQSAEYSVIKPLLGMGASTQNLYKKNSAGLTPAHMVFFMNYVQDENKQQAIEKTNDIVLANITTGRALTSRYQNMSFFDFAELMKDRNPDFYKKLKRKFYFESKIRPNDMKTLRENLLKSTDSVKLFKEMSYGGGK